MRIECDHCHRIGEARLTADGDRVMHACGFCGKSSSVKLETGAGAGTSAATGAGVVAEPAAPDGELADAWIACVDAWDDPAAHDRVAVLALTRHRSPWLAARYRAVLRDRPGDAIAAARISRIGRMAEAALRATALPPVDAPVRRSGPYVVLVVVVVLVAAGLVYAVRVIGARRQAVGNQHGARTPAVPVDAGRPAPLPHPPIESHPPGR